MAALQRIERHVEHGHVVGHEEGVELAALERLREALEVREVKIGIRESAGIPPCSGMDTRRPHEGCELDVVASLPTSRASPNAFKSRQQRSAIVRCHYRRCAVRQITPWHLVDSKRPYASGSSWRAPKLFLCLPDGRRCRLRPAR